MASTDADSASHDLTKLAVIAVYFNPVRYETRYDLYRNFEQHMSDSGVFLLTVECIFESAPVFRLPKQVFEVTQADNPRHMQLTAPSILWMKENLINIAVKHLPEHFEYVAWIDSDIEFDVSLPKYNDLVVLAYLRSKMTISTPYNDWQTLFGNQDRISLGFFSPLLPERPPVSS